jgi:hypothetical protein
MYAIRFSALLCLAVLVAWIDWKKNGEEASRWREYGFAFLCGLTGAAFGIGWDQVTVTLSADYFELHKGLNPEDGPLRLQALILGFKAGFFGGLVVGMVFLMTNNPKKNSARRALPYRQLIKRSIYPLLAIFPAALLGMWLFESYDPFDRAATLRFMLSKIAIIDYLQVWGLHAGLYAGALLGLCLGCVSINRARNRLSELEQAPPSGQGIGAVP